MLHLEQPINGDEEMHWFSAIDPPFQIAEFAWWTQEHKFRRQPIVPQGAIREAVDNLANHTAGGQIRFQTNATKLVIKAKLFGASISDHMPATAVNGFDCYFGLPCFQLYYSTTRFTQIAEQYESVMFDSIESKLRCVTLNFPLYQGVHELQIGVNADAVIMSMVMGCEKRHVCQLRFGNPY